MKKTSLKLQVLDCTIRDGGYLNNWAFEDKVVREAYRVLSKSGVDYVELGYRCAGDDLKKGAHGKWRFTREEDIDYIARGINGAKIAVMVDYGRAGLEEIGYKSGSLIDMVRVAAHKNKFSDSLAFAEQIKKRGFEVSLNLMGYTGYSPRERKEVIKALKGADIDFVYIADSYGSLFPDHIRELCEPFAGLPHIRLGFHPHNNLQMALANTLEAIKSGVSMIDASIYGMGRAAGNLPIEAILSYLNLVHKNKYDVIPLLTLIDQYFVAFNKEIEWGYQLPYMISGIFQCHPDYARNLVERHEYTIEDIWHIIRRIKGKKVVGFSREAMEEAIRQGEGSAAPLKVPYLNRHKGHDFLILANGPSLKNYKNKLDSFIKKYEPVTLGANYLGGLFIPHYHAFNNKRRLMIYADSVDQKSSILLGQHISRSMIKEYVDRDFESLYYKDTLNPDFDITNGIIQSNCRTISVLLIAVAIVMGAKRIFVAGMDGYDKFSKEKSHFYPEKDEAENRQTLMEKQEWISTFLHRINQYLLDDGKKGISILTPTVYKKFYSDIDILLK